MYDASPRFLNQLAADRRESLRGSATWADSPLRRALGAVLARFRPVPPVEVPAPRATTETPVLTRREHEVVLLVAEGLTNAQIAERLWISPGTVRRHLENVFAKLGVHTRTAAVAMLRRDEPRT
jgi:DNA-binding CsgD family transcriptional regulator